jgi:hypothetical protein
MSRSGATCVCCGLPSMIREDLRIEGEAGNLGTVMTAVVVDGPDGRRRRNVLQQKQQVKLSDCLPRYLLESRTNGFRKEPAGQEAVPRLLCTSSD